MLWIKHIGYSSRLEPLQISLKARLNYVIGLDTDHTLASNTNFQIFTNYIEKSEEENKLSGSILPNCITVHIRAVFMIGSNAIKKSSKFDEWFIQFVIWRDPGGILNILCLTSRTTVTSARMLEDDTSCHRARNLCVFSRVQKGTQGLTHKGCVLQRVSLGALSDVTVFLEMRQSIVDVYISKGLFLRFMMKWFLYKSVQC